MASTVLIAEDSSVIRNITKRVLSFQNYTLISAKNGSDVLQKLESEPVDLILMDINMPVMDGLECTKKIRTHAKEAIRSIPIIAVTGNAKNYTKEEYQALGINEFLQKPLNFDVLVHHVRKILG